MSILSRIKQRQVAAKSAAPALSCVQNIPRPDRQAYLHASTVFIHFKEDRKTLDIVKRIYEREYNREEDCWTAPLTLDAINKLREGSFTIDPKILKWEADLFEPPVFDPNFKVPGLQHSEYLKPYQWEGIQHIEWWNGRALLADDQGLGKTLQVLAWLQYRKEVRPALIVCPAIAKITWLEEAEFWMDNPSVQIISGNKSTKVWGEIVVINYDILVQSKDGKDTLRQDIWDVDWKFIGLDEAHYITNEETMRGWAIRNLVDNTPHVIPITATPSRHRPRDMFPLINMVDKRVFPSYYKYCHRYCGAKKGYKNTWDFSGSSNELELNDLLMKSVMIRRKKQDVYKDLPDKIRYVISFDIENRKEYEEVELGFFDLLDKEEYEQKSNHIFAKMEKLRQLTVKGKIQACIEWIEDLLETEDKLVIFAEHEATLSMVQKAFGDICVRVDGSNNDPKKRHAARIAFQRCKRCGVLKERHAISKDACEEWIPDLKTRIFLASRAGITNITLTAAEHVVFLELWPSPKDHDQAEDRVYGRSGDLHGATAWYLIGYNTIETRQAAMYDLKNSRLEKVMDGRELDEKMMLTMLMKDYQKKRG